MKPAIIPEHYDYVAVYLTDRCPLRCAYCITEHNDTRFISGTEAATRLKPKQWAEGLNRLQLPKGVPLTLQGGEPLVYPGVWDLLEVLEHPIDILTALPANAQMKQWRKLSNSTLNKLRRDAPYPTIRVSYHVNQNKLEDLIERVKELQELVPVGIYTVDHPDTAEETARARELCSQNGVFFKTKEFLGHHKGKLYGTYKYPESVGGKVVKEEVLCKNSVLIFGPDGLSYRCHSDLYHKRKSLAFGSVTDEHFLVEDKLRSCKFFGMCSECDVKIKNNHEQIFGYTSVTIEFPDQEKSAIARHG